MRALTSRWRPVNHAMLHPLIHDLRCPACGVALRPNPATVLGPVRCGCGAAYPVTEDGVLQLISPEFRAELLPFTAAVHAYRAAHGIGQLDPRELPEMPHLGARRGDPAWRQRLADLLVVRGVLAVGYGRRRLRVLEIGAWNHWLTAHLSAWGHEVVAMDTFVDSVDGLGARRWHQRPRWLSVQLDLRDVRPLGQGWDVVILNRCLQFTDRPARWLRQVPALLAPGGAAVLLGLNFFARPAAKIRATAALQSAFRGATGRSLFLHPTRGWLGRVDAAGMARLGVRMWPYPSPRLLAADARSLRQPGRPVHRWGLWRPHRVSVTSAPEIDDDPGR